jgi:predicted phosphodiesterase
MKRSRLLSVALLCLFSFLLFMGLWVFSLNFNEYTGVNDVVTRAINEGKPWSFAVLGDTRSDGEAGNKGVNDIVIKAIAKDVVKDGCDLVLVPGDLINGKSEDNLSVEKQFENWKISMSPIYNAGIKVYTVRGNHESEDKAAYIQAFGADNPDDGPKSEKNLTYSFTHKNAFFIGVDEYVDPHKVNQKWIDSQLKNNSQQHIFVFGHEPAFRVEHKDCLEVHPKTRDKFWDSVGNAGCRVYFCGHDHFYDRASIQDDSGNEIYQIIVGSGGAPLANLGSSEGKENSKFKRKYHNQGDYGYSLVTVDGDKVNIEWKAWNGSGDPTWVTKDSFQLNKVASTAA